jgi:soluble lytic murein transglycosylase-like protein
LTPLRARPSWCRWAAFCLVATAAPARAELVVLTGGEVVKVAAYEAVDEDARLTLPAGGTMILPLLRIERVVDDEIVPAPEPAPAAPGIAVRFDAAQPVPEGPYGALMYEAARRHALNPQVVAAVIRAESAFNPRAVSRKGACGLMQIMPATGQRFGLSRRELFEPRKNIDAGVRYLALLAERFQDELPLVLAAYNAGEGSVDRYRGVPPYRETREYIRRIYRSLGAATEVADVGSLGSSTLGLRAGK